MAKYYKKDLMFKCKFCNFVCKKLYFQTDWFQCKDCTVIYLLENNIIMLETYYLNDDDNCIIEIDYKYNITSIYTRKINPIRFYQIINITPNNYKDKILMLLALQ